MKNPLLAFVAVIFLDIVSFAQTSPALQITSPRDWDFVEMGQTITVSVTADPSISDIAIVSPLGFSQNTSSPLQFLFTIPTDVASDSYEISAVGLGADGQMVASDPVIVYAETSDWPTAIEVQPDYLEFDSPGKSTQLRVIGTLPDGTKNDCTRAGAIDYESYDESVVTVDYTGIVTAIGPGSTSIYVGYGAPYTINVVVKGPPPPMIDTITPNSGSATTAVSLAGVYFGAAQGTSTVTFNGVPSAPFSWEDTTITAPVPTGLPMGKVGVVVTVNGMSSNSINFTLQSDVSITNLSPTVGAGSSPVTISGTNFGDIQGSSTVSFGGMNSVATSWGTTSITAPVPRDLPAGVVNIVITENGLPSNSLPFTVVPVITALSSYSGAVGTPVTITGTGFGGSQGTSTVTFNGVPASPTSWAPNSITVLVPPGSASGPVVVTVSGLDTNGVPFTVPTPPPVIASISPGSGPVNTELTITGTNFGTTQGSGAVFFPGMSVAPTSWSDTNITVLVPASLTAGNTSVTVIVNGTASNSVVFGVTPRITGLSASSGSVGTLVTIAGTAFGNSQGTNTVTFGGINSVPTYWSATSITAAVPDGLTSGNLNVLVTVNGLSSNGSSFAVLPQLTSLSANSGPVGTPITITGTAFGPTQDSSAITFGGIPAIATSWSATSISTTVPNGASSGALNVVVTVNGLASNALSFTAIPHIGSLSPASGPVGTTITITGTGFGGTQNTSTVKFGTLTATPTSWSDTAIGVPVPSGLAIGTVNVVVSVNTQSSNGSPFSVTRH